MTPSVKAWHVVKAVTSMLLEKPLSSRNAERVAQLYRIVEHTAKGGQVLAPRKRK